VLSREQSKFGAGQDNLWSCQHFQALKSSESQHLTVDPDASSINIGWPFCSIFRLACLGTEQSSSASISDKDVVCVMNVTRKKVRWCFANRPNEHSDPPPCDQWNRSCRPTSLRRSIHSTPEKR